MCAFWKKWFNKGEPELLKDLSHPRDLNLNDVVQFDDAFSLPEEIRDTAYTVVSIDTYQFEYSQEPAWTLKSAGHKALFLSLKEEDGQTQIGLSLKLTREQVESWFDPDDFSRIFDQDSELELTPLNTEAGFAPWVDGPYHIGSNVQRAYYYAEDFRGRSAPNLEGEGEPLDYYYLVNQSETHALEIEVYKTGATEVSLTQYQPVRAIKEMWPAK